MYNYINRNLFIKKLRFADFMQVHTNLSDLPNFKNAVITIGTFDGVHLGHQSILQQLKLVAKEINGETVIISFHPHPRKIISSVLEDIKLLNTLQEKIELLSKEGIDHFVVVPFTRDFANQTAEQYIDDFLVKNFSPHTIIIGYDHKFGKGRQGDYHLLDQAGVKYGFNVQEINEKIIQELIISSTKIRNALGECNINLANTLLGYFYFFEGVVVEGNKLGRTIGFPTANLHIANKEKLIPADGVYAVELTIDNNNAILQGMMNIGIRPTVDGKKRMIEVNIFDFDKEIYGSTIRVFIKNHLRNEVKFDGIDSLKEQLKKDEILVRKFLQN